MAHDGAATGTAQTVTAMQYRTLTAFIWLWGFLHYSGAKAAPAPNGAA